MKTIRSISLTILGVCVGQMIFHLFVPSPAAPHFWCTFAIIALTTYTITAVNHRQ